MSHKNLSAKNKIPKLLKSKLSNQKIKLIYKKFEKSLNINENFIVAVSGGPDSLALAFLAKIYSIKKKLSPRFYIVDHKLRPGSTKEAKDVKKILHKYSISADILTWKGKKPSKNIQSLARNKRYELLFNQGNKFQISNILLGHHRDDLLENFFLRMLRGSGLKGLISFDKRNRIGEKKLLRPLLDQKKEDLIYIAKFVFNFYASDPTNQDEKYRRIKVRKLIKELEKEGLDKKKFFETIKNLKYSNSVVDYCVKQNLKKNSFFSEKKNKLVLNEIFFSQPYEVIFRSLSESIKLIGKKYYPVRGKKLNKIITYLKKQNSYKATLGGCVIEKVNQTVIILKEH